MFLGGGTNALVGVAAGDTGCGSAAPIGSEGGSVLRRTPRTAMTNAALKAAAANALTSVTVHVMPRRLLSSGLREFAAGMGNGSLRPSVTI